MDTHEGKNKNHAWIPVVHIHVETGGGREEEPTLNPKPGNYAWYLADGF